MKSSWTKPPILIDTMHGIGDQIYQRPLIKLLVERGDVYINTFLQPLYSDIPGLKFVSPPETGTYRTQSKAACILSTVELPPTYKTINPLYSGEEMVHTSIVALFAKKFGVEDVVGCLEWTLPPFGHLFDHQRIELPEKKIAVIRPGTIRKEWEIHTRNPLPSYIDWCAKVLAENGYYVISIADCDRDQEWLAPGTRTPAHLFLHSGELGLWGTLDLIRRADVVVGGPGFIVPAAVSTHTPLFTIFGGRMAYDTPYKLFHNTMDMTKVGWAVPDNPCRCTLAVHNCDKTIKDLETRFLEFLMRTQ